MRSNLETSTLKILPVLLGFFVMGFCDVVGIATSYIKAEFNLTETLAGFIPSMVFLWFLLLSIPTAILMNKIGRKNTVQISNVVTIVGMIIPLVDYSFGSCIVAFALLGIGNTMLQVSLNPLLTNVVKGAALTSSLTAGQVVKAVSSFSGPFIAAVCVGYFGHWRYIFPIFAGITLLSSIWLRLVHIEEDRPTDVAKFGQTFGLLKNPTILLCFLGVAFIVGADVGMNTVTPKLLIERCNISLEKAGLGSSVYFLCRTLGAFLGAFLLVKMADMKYFKIHVTIALLAVVILYFMHSEVSILIMVGVIGFACSGLFSVIFSQAIQTLPEKANEISGLMITGVFGGAVIPPLMGFLTDQIGSQIGSLMVITLCIVYLSFYSFTLKPVK
jgi:FHS family L-fucose permease-like MFS transporter